MPDAALIAAAWPGVFSAALVLLASAWIAPKTKKENDRG